MKQLYVVAKKHLELHGVFYLCLLGLSPLYVTWLNILPIAVHGDEAHTALGALEIWQGTTIFGVNWYDLPILSFVPHILGMLLFGKNIVGDRMGSVLFGIGTLPFLYALVSRWYNRRIGIITMLLLATANIWLALSRVGIAYVQAGFLLIASIYFLWRTYTSRKLAWAMCAGFTLGMTIYAYYAARITSVVIFPLILGTIIFTKHKKTALIKTFFVIFTMFAVMLPQLLYFAQHPSTFSSRTKEVFIFSDDISVVTLRHDQYKNASMVDVIMAQANKAVHIEKGDTGGQYGYKGWLLDPLTICLFLLGLVVGYKKGWKKFLFLLYWFLLAFVAGIILTIDPIFLPRFVIGMPVVFIFAALGFDFIYIQLKKFHYIQQIIALILLLIIIVWNLQTYFVYYPQQQLIGKAGDRNALNATNIAHYINTLPPEYEVLFLTPPNLYADFGTLQFLSPQTKRLDVHEPATFPIPSICPRGVIYIIYPNYKEKYQQLREKCLSASFSIKTDPQGTIEYYILQTSLY